MPKEVKYYMCEICKTQYKDKEKAKACEKSHCLPIGIPLMLTFWFLAEYCRRKGAKGGEGE